MNSTPLSDGESLPQAGDTEGGTGSLPLQSTRFANESVTVVAQHVAAGWTVADAGCAALAGDAEYRVREIVQEAAKFMRHAKRIVLRVDDLAAAFRVLNIDPLYGITSRDALKFSSVGSTKGLYYVSEREVPLSVAVQRELPSPPPSVTLTAHWLAIQGSQPMIAQNPVPRSDAEGVRDTAAVKAGEKGASSGKRRKRDELPHSSALAVASDAVVVKPLVKHVLSRELQLYLDHVVDALAGEDVSLRIASLRSVSEEPGLQQLLPYFVRHACDTIAGNLRNHVQLARALQLVGALIVNPNFDLDRYLHQLLPSILTCLVGKRLCRAPSDDHWSLRDYASEIVVNVCSRYAAEYVSLQPRITKTLSDALNDHSKPITTHYGAVVGLSGLGRHVIEPLLLWMLPKYSAILDDELDDRARHSTMRRIELLKMYGALIHAAVAHALELTPQKYEQPGEPVLSFEQSSDVLQPGFRSAEVGQEQGGFSMSSSAAGVTSTSKALDGSKALATDPSAGKAAGEMEAQAQETWVQLPLKATRSTFEQIQGLSDEQQLRISSVIPNFEARSRELHDALGSSAFPCSYTLRLPSF